MCGLHPDAVRARVGLIEQDPFVLDQSIRQNLLFARDSTTDLVLRDLVGTARAAGRTVLLVSHVPVSAGLVDRRIRMDGGRIVRT